jgi:hypothetical protein
VDLDFRRSDAEASTQFGPPLQGTTGTWLSPMVSGSPNIRFMFWTA